MNSDWTDTTLGEISTRTIGRTPPRKDAKYWTTDATARPFCSIGDMKSHIIRGGKEGITEVAESEGKAKRVPSGSLLLSFKLSLGRVGITDRDVFINEAIAWIRPNEGVERDFLALALENLNWSELGSHAVKGKTLNSESLDALPIPLPPLAEQERIVDLIGSLDDAIEAAEGVAEGLTHARSEYRRSSLALASQGRHQKLAELAKSRLGKSLVAKKDAPQAPYLRNANVRWGHIDLNGLNSMPFSEADRLRYDLKAGDVLICEGGEVGRAAVLESNLDGVYFQNAVHRVRCGDSLDPHFLQLCMEQMADDGTLNLHSGGSTIPHLSAGNLEKLPIPAVNIDQQRLISRMASSMLEAVRQMNSHLASLRALRAELLNALLSGAHAIPETYDQPVLPAAA